MSAPPRHGPGRTRTTSAHDADPTTSTSSRGDWNRQTVPAPSASGGASPRLQSRKKAVVMHYLTPEYPGWRPPPGHGVHFGHGPAPGGSGRGYQGTAHGRARLYLSRMNAERKISAPAAPLSHHVSLSLSSDSGANSGTNSPPALKLRGEAPDSNPGDTKQGRKLSSLSSFDGQRTRTYLPGDDEELDHKLAQKLGISDSLSDGHITPSRTSFSSPVPLHPGILKHSDHDLRSHQNAAFDAGEAGDTSGLPGPHAGPGPGGMTTASSQSSSGTGLIGGPCGGAPATPVTPGSASSPSLTSPTSPFSLGSATSQTSEPRRRVSIIVQEETERSKKLSTSSYASHASSASTHVSHGSHVSKATDLHQHTEENGKTPNNTGNGLHKKRSCIEIMYNKVYPERNIESSSWYLFCEKVRKKDEEANADAWEPPHWQSVCPYPFCPTYRQFARFLGLTLVVLLLWGSAFAVLGDTLAPGGGLFSLACLVVAAHFGGWLVSLITLPALAGMLLVGILFANVGLYEVSADMVEVVSVLRKIALVIILTRAGLDLDPPALKRLLCTVLRIGLIPWVIECVVLAILMHYLFAMPWIWGIMLGATVAAVSPAVTVPCLFRLRARGYGTAKGIPTLIIAISGIDDAASVAGFGIISSIMFSHDSLLYQIIQGPLSIVMGLGFGVLWGVLAKYVPERNDPFVVPMRVLMLFGGGLIAVLGSESIGLGGAGPLAVVAAAFVSCYSWTQQGWKFEENPVATAFEIFWMVFEPILFGLTGTMIKIDELDPQNAVYIIGSLCAGFAIRIASTIGTTYGTRLNMKEKIFVALSLMAKASVQAALCTVPLDLIRETSSEGETGENDRTHAELFLRTCVMSILLTAPTIAILMTLLGPRLLTKTTVDPEFPENWRRHTRPSLRDISIIDEGDEDDDEDLGKLSRRSSRRRSSYAKDSSVKDGKEAGNHTTATPASPTNAHTRETTLTTTSVP